VAKFKYHPSHLTVKLLGTTYPATQCYIPEDCILQDKLSSENRRHSRIIPQMAELLLKEVEETGSTKARECMGEVVYFYATGAGTTTFSP
jgi:hypothetical protein